MTSTICTTLEPKTSSSHVMDYRNSNMAGRPLPSIPRGTSSSHSAYKYVTSEPSLSSITGANMITMHPPTPPQVHALASTSSLQPDETIAFVQSDSSSSSGPLDGSQPTIILRSKRVRGQLSPLRIPAEQFTLPPPATRSKPAASKSEPRARERVIRPPLDLEEPSDNVTPQPPPIGRSRGSSSIAAKLRNNFETALTRHVSASHVDTLIESQSLPIPPATVSAILTSEARLLRKKSGEPIKSSLKSAKPPGLSVVTKPSSSKSEPSTPTKVVHFDAQLEHVKLFLAEQKPLAVSRDGSPTDTSGTDNEFPAFIYGHSSDEEGAMKSLVMHVTNMRKKRMPDADIGLQELTMSQDSTSIHGRVKVKNIAFEKRLAVRFTFDWWQTTSEVTAKYVESLEGNTFDIFGFTIRLNDIIARIEEKTLFLALRYTVAGREIWDNNGGENYLAKFTKSKVQPQKMTSNSEDVPSGSVITHLKSKLEQVAQGQENGVSFLAQRVHHQARLEAQKPPTLQADKPLSARYDSSWKAVPPKPPPHLRTSTHPSSPNTIPWPQKMSPVPRKGFDLPPRSPQTSALGSPGLDDVVRHQSAYADSDIDDTAFRLPPPRRHHQRGYFDRALSSTSRIKMTPPGTPHMLGIKVGAVSTLRTSPSMPRFRDTSQKISPYSNPSVANFLPAWAAAQHVPTGGSEGSTPSISSSSSSCTTSPSPSPTEDFMHAMTSQRCSRESSPASASSCNERDNYSSFLNRFCFYTGTGTDASLDDIPRSHSASSIEEFLLHSPPTGAFSLDYSSPFDTPTRRSPSFDEIAYRSGSSTPTAGSFVTSESRPSTHILG